jgi:hypothetical protein
MVMMMTFLLWKCFSAFHALGNLKWQTSQMAPIELWLIFGGILSQVGGPLFLFSFTLVNPLRIAAASNHRPQPSSPGQPRTNQELPGSMLTRGSRKPTLSITGVA